MDAGGKWYNYRDPFHQYFKNPKIHPDALSGIAVYGGVCGRMAQLEWRKTGCMGLPATMKSEPGHCAGFKFRPGVGVSTTLTVAGGCLVCERKNSKCAASPDPAPCSSFLVESGEATDELDMHKVIKEAETGQCLDLMGGPALGLWHCNGGANQKFKE